MEVHRRHLLKSALLAAAAQAPMHAAPAKPGMPGPYPGRVIAVHHSAPIVNDTYQAKPIEQMMYKGMLELTGAPGWPDAWRALFERGDVVGIKVSPVGGTKLCSDALVLHQILDGLSQAGVRPRDVIVFSRYRAEIRETGIDKWLPEGVRWTAPSEAYNDIQLDMEGYDPDHYMEMALIKPGECCKFHVASVCKRDKDLEVVQLGCRNLWLTSLGYLIRGQVSTAPYS